MRQLDIVVNRVGARAVNFGVPSVYQRGPKLEIKHKSHCFQKSELVDWGAIGACPPFSAGPSRDKGYSFS